jgi:hypothetical protein
MYRLVVLASVGQFMDGGVDARRLRAKLIQLTEFGRSTESKVEDRNEQEEILHQSFSARKGCQMLEHHLPGCHKESKDTCCNRCTVFELFQEAKRYH